MSESSRALVQSPANSAARGESLLQVLSASPRCPSQSDLLARRRVLAKTSTLRLPLSFQSSCLPFAGPWSAGCGTPVHVKSPTCIRCTLLGFLMHPVELHLLFRSQHALQLLVCAVAHLVAQCRQRIELRPNRSEELTHLLATILENAVERRTLRRCQVELASHPVNAAAAMGRTPMLQRAITRDPNGCTCNEGANEEEQSVPFRPLHHLLRSVRENVLKRSIALIRPIGSSDELSPRRNSFRRRRLHDGFICHLILRLTELMTDESANDEQRGGGDQADFRPATQHRPPAMFALSR